MTKWNILISDDLAQAGRERLATQANVTFSPGLSPAALLDAIQNAEALVVRGRTKVTAEVLAAAPRLRVIGRAGVGVDNIDLEAARAQGVIVVNAPTATTIAVAELTFGLLLAVARHIPRADASMKDGQWLKKQLKGVEIFGKTLGILGYGRIGAEVAKRAAAFGMEVLAYDPYLTPETIRNRGAHPVSLEALYQQSDFLSLHLPLTEETRGMLSADAFARMKPGIRLVCAARGGIVDEAALLQALENGQVAAAGLDVFAQEPPKDSPLVRHPQVVATPHIGAQTHEAQIRAAEHVAEEVLRALNGEPLRWRVV